ncbi:MAG: DUF1501 domain-containing protein [Bacteroidetes bacterium]|nr:DUF1501 domain-containing protein [Bacteroidota bacterium]
MKRKQFIKTAAAGTLLPISLNGFSMKSWSQSSLLRLLGARAMDSGKVFVLIQLNGGNDGLNMVIPLDQYSNLSKARNNVLIPDTQVLGLSGVSATGLHPAMDGLRQMYNNGLVNIVQSVGYTSPSFSHFRATDIWMTGSDSNENWTTGWLGRFLDGQFPAFPTGYPNTTMPDPLALQIGSQVSLSFMGPAQNMAMSITDPANFYNLVNGSTDPTPNSHAGDELAFLRLMANQTNQYATVIKAAAAAASNQSSKYVSGNSLSDQLKIVARLIKGGLKTPVYMVSMGGFDTHSQQVDSTDHSIGSHATLLKRLSEAIYAFQDDLKLMGIEDRVAGMTFSEFGRRIMSNGSGGTDHGAAAPLVVFGTGVQSGIIGNNPAIPSTVTVNDNVPMQYDFRQVYASVLADWFGLSTSEVSAAMGGKSFNPLPVFKANLSRINDWAEVSGRVQLYDVQPNPVRDSATFRFYTDGGHLDIQVFDALGNRIAIPVSGRFVKGEHTASWETKGLKPGNYFYQLSHGNQRTTRVLSVL